MSAKLERFLNRLLLVVIAASAVATARGYEGAAAASLYFLAAVSFGGLFAPVPTLAQDPDDEDDFS
ncbi:MAG: hypothetical protein PVI23_13485 [Maricaulaceae bacterium]|jgi:hypothetical protein